LYFALQTRPFFFLGGTLRIRLDQDFFVVEIHEDGWHVGGSRMTTDRRKTKVVSTSRFFKFPDSGYLDEKQPKLAWEFPIRRADNVMYNVRGCKG